MSDAVDLLYVCLVVAVPFMLGIVFGREFRRPPETWEHRLGASLSSITSAFWRTKAIVGEPVIVARICTIQTPGKPDLEITIREAA